MRKASIIVSSYYQSNRLFDLDNPISNRDNCLFAYSILKDEMRKRGYNLSTCDINRPKESEIVLYNDVPRSLPSRAESARSMLFLWESEIIRPDNFDIKKHAHFAKVFTWHDDWAGKNGYIKVQHAQAIPKNIIIDNSRPGFIAMIAGNKSNKDERELYSERLKAIRWFEAEHPDEFDLFGFGWDECTFTGKRMVHALNRINLFKKIFAERRPSYRGRVVSKIRTLQEYRFSVCYENVRDIPGYITEKIFDSLFAGCVPIYWGAPNITEYIPAEIFIDRREFTSYQDLYKHLKQMTESEYRSKQHAIKEFVEGTAILPFTAEKFAQTVVSEIIQTTSNNTLSNTLNE